MSTDLKSLYSFKVSNGRQESMQPNRRRAAKQIASWVRQGYDRNKMTAEKRTGGHFEHDSETFTLVDKYLQAPVKSNGHKPAVKHVTVKSALRELAAAVKLAQSTEDLTDAHFDAIRERYNALYNAAYTDGHDMTGDESEEDEESDEGEDE